jgi:hypothetical protein
MQYLPANNKIFILLCIKSHTNFFKTECGNEDSSLVGALRMYIDHKGWDISDIAVNANLYYQLKEGKRIAIIDRDIVFLSEVRTEKPST